MVLSVGWHSYVTVTLPPSSESKRSYRARCRQAMDQNATRVVSCCRCDGNATVGLTGLVFQHAHTYIPDVALAEFPPIRLPFSINTTGAPALDASMEAARPAKPPPTTTTGSCRAGGGTRSEPKGR